MSLFAAWVVYPLVLLALCAGLGLLVDALGGRRLSGALVVPVGLAAMVVVGQFTTMTDATAGLTVAVICVLAALGVAVSLPWRFGRPDPWPAAVAFGVFAVFGAPVLLTGEPTFAGYIKLDDTATWLALTDRVMEHGRDLSGLEPSTYRATLEANLPGGYPIGVFVPFGAAQRLVGGDLAWVFQPYLSFLAAMLSLCLWKLTGATLRRPSARACAAFIAAQPALLFGYALWGGVKELAAATFVALAAALAPAVVRSDALPRDAALLALSAGALVGVLSLGGLVWLAPMLLLLGHLAWRDFGGRDWAEHAAAFASTLAVFAIPVLLAGGFSPFQSGLTAESEIGNLIGPLSPLQALGVWPAGDFRVHPASEFATGALIAVTLFSALLGLHAGWRRRGPIGLLYAASLPAAAAIVLVGSPWVDAKALATAAPAALLLAIAGALATLRLSRPLGAVLAVVVAGGVLWSNVLAYGGADLAPYGQLRELQRVGEEIAGQGPTLMTEYNPYGARHFLRDADAEGASELRVRTVPLRGGGVAEKGASVDTDELDADALLEYRTLVLRRSPLRSRPPSPYRLVDSGRYYEVWQRPLRRFGAIPEHYGYGRGGEPAAVPDCGEIGGIGLVALQNRMPAPRLLAARHAPVHAVEDDGIVTLPRRGRYEAWLGGSVRGSATLYVDGRRVGEVRRQLQNEGGFVSFGEVRLGAGPHAVELRLGGADLHPGSGGFPRPPTGPLVFTLRSGAAGRLVSVPLERSGRLCGRPWDWVEAVGSER